MFSGSAVIRRPPRFTGAAGRKSGRFLREPDSLLGRPAPRWSGTAGARSALYVAGLGRRVTATDPPSVAVKNTWRVAGEKGVNRSFFCFPRGRAASPPSFPSPQVDFVQESGMFHPPAPRVGRLIRLDRFCRGKGRRGGDRRLVFLGKARPDRAFPLVMLPRLFQSEQDIASIEKYREDRPGTLQARGSCG